MRRGVHPLRYLRIQILGMHEEMALACLNSSHPSPFRGPMLSSPLPFSAAWYICARPLQCPPCPFLSLQRDRRPPALAPGSTQHAVPCSRGTGAAVQSRIPCRRAGRCGCRAGSCNKLCSAGGCGRGATCARQHGNSCISSCNNWCNNCTEQGNNYNNCNNCFSSGPSSRSARGQRGWEGISYSPAPTARERRLRYHNRPCGFYRATAAATTTATAATATPPGAAATEPPLSPLQCLCLPCRRTEQAAEPSACSRAREW